MPAKKRAFVRVLAQIFDDACFRANAVQRSEGGMAVASNQEETYTEEDEEVIAERLVSLGYLE